ncbi:MAG TPA: fumarylacetoacetate hydrolase family protein [Dehalococcoidia bacterium]|nr:fumarylacetoacetate hydrolase family protein [Dehalococcoidia bacterium]
MKIVVFGPDRRVGALQGNQVIDLNGAYAKFARETQDEPLPQAMASAMAPANLQEFIEAGPRAVESAHKAIEYLTKKAGDRLGLKGEHLLHDAGSVKIHAPLPSMSTRIAMAGGNYADHALGMLRRRTPDITEAQAVEDTRKTGIWGFWKLAPNVIGPDDELTYPDKTQRLDYEAEVVIVLNKRAKDVPESKVKDYIWGYTLQNDWSLRDQPEAGNYKFVVAKNFDGSSSLGPCIVVAEISDPTNVPFELHVNGELRQKGNTKDMIFSFGEFLEYLSKDTTLLPGDMISGGTCAGTAADASPREADGSLSGKLFCHVGDLVHISSPLIGTLRNRVVAK